MVYGLSNGHVTQSTPNTQSVCYRNYFQDTENWPLFRCMLECYFVMVLMMYLMCVMIRMHLWPPVVCTKAQQWQRQVVNWSYLQRCWRYSKKMDIAFSSSHRWGLIAVPSFVSRLQKYMLSFCSYHKIYHFLLTQINWLLATSILLAACTNQLSSSRPLPEEVILKLQN